jgi:hypothetical protein
MKGNLRFSSFLLLAYSLIPKLRPANRVWSVRHTEANKGMCAGFEQHVRCLMATGATARAIREGLSIPQCNALPINIGSCFILCSGAEVRLVYKTKGSIGIGILPVYVHAHSGVRENYSMGIR